MPKIKNYTAIHQSSPYAYEWNHDNIDHMSVNVSKRLPSTDADDEEELYWKVEIWHAGHYLELGPLSHNKEDMRKIAVNWMRDHPEGWEYERV